jgi:uncharacterized membrane protein HdeD (DUF308 family)
MDSGGELHDFRGRRWLGVVLRGAHLIAVISFAATLLRAPPVALPEHAGIAVLVSGVLVWLLDLWHRPAHLLEGAGLSMLLKLMLVAAMIVWPAQRVPLFWLVVAWSAIFSHAPRSFRNARLGKPRD